MYCTQFKCKQTKTFIILLSRKLCGNNGPSSIVSPTQEMKRFKTQQLIVLYWHITLSTAGPVLSKEQYVNFSQQRLLSLWAGLGTCAIKAEYKLCMERSIIQSRASLVSGSDSHLLD